nr:MAG TPA: hypothetical protein [Caudoviricetes sp.]
MALPSWLHRSDDSKHRISDNLVFLFRITY